MENPACDNLPSISNNLPDGSFIPIKPTTQREIPLRREKTEWQLKELFEDTLPKVNFQIPTTNFEPWSISFGTLIATDPEKISPDYLFGKLEVTRTDCGPDASGTGSITKPHVKISLYLFIPQTKNINDLIDYVRKTEQSFIIDTSTDPARCTNFNNPYDGGSSYNIRHGESVTPNDTLLQNKKFNLGPSTVSSYNYMEFSRIFPLRENPSESSIYLNKDGVFHISLYPPSKKI